MGSFDKDNRFAGADDYDEYEEELIESDEVDDSLGGYDDEYDEYADEYEDEYPPEDEYADEYADYPEEEQGYDEYTGDLVAGQGYDSAYQDERLDTVLKELADLKNSLPKQDDKNAYGQFGSYASPFVSPYNSINPQTPPYNGAFGAINYNSMPYGNPFGLPPAQPPVVQFVPYPSVAPIMGMGDNKGVATPNGIQPPQVHTGDLVVMNELGRIREDMGRVHTDHKVQSEISRLREDLVKDRLLDQRERESRKEVQSEIRALDRRMADMQRQNQDAELRNYQDSVKADIKGLADKIDAITAQEQNKELRYQQAQIQNAFLSEVGRLNDKYERLETILKNDLSPQNKGVVRPNRGFEGGSIATRTKDNTQAIEPRQINSNLGSNGASGFNNNDANSKSSINNSTPLMSAPNNIPYNHLGIGGYNNANGNFVNPNNNYDATRELPRTQRRPKQRTEPVGGVEQRSIDTVAFANANAQMFAQSNAQYNELAQEISKLVTKLGELPKISDVSDTVERIRLHLISLADTQSEQVVNEMAQVKTLVGQVTELVTQLYNKPTDTTSNDTILEGLGVVSEQLSTIVESAKQATNDSRALLDTINTTSNTVVTTIGATATSVIDTIRENASQTINFINDVAKSSEQVLSGVETLSTKSDTIVNTTNTIESKVDTVDTKSDLLLENSQTIIESLGDISTKSNTVVELINTLQNTAHDILGNVDGSANLDKDSQGRAEVLGAIGELKNQLEETRNYLGGAIDEQGNPVTLSSTNDGILRKLDTVLGTLDSLGKLDTLDTISGSLDNLSKLDQLDNITGAIGKLEVLDAIAGGINAQTQVAHSTTNALTLSAETLQTVGKQIAELRDTINGSFARSADIVDIRDILGIIVDKLDGVPVGTTNPITTERYSGTIDTLREGVMGVVAKLDELSITSDNGVARVLSDIAGLRDYIDSIAALQNNLPTPILSDSGKGHTQELDKIYGINTELSNDLFAINRKLDSLEAKFAGAVIGEKDGIKTIEIDGNTSALYSELATLKNNLEDELNNIFGKINQLYEDLSTRAIGQANDINGVVANDIGTKLEEYVASNNENFAKIVEAIQVLQHASPNVEGAYQYGDGNLQDLATRIEVLANENEQRLNSVAEIMDKLQNSMQQNSESLEQLGSFRHSDAFESIAEQNKQVVADLTAQLEDLHENFAGKFKELSDLMQWMANLTADSENGQNGFAEASGIFNTLAEKVENVTEENRAYTTDMLATLTDRIEVLAEDGKSHTENLLSGMFDRMESIAEDNKSNLDGLLTDAVDNIGTLVDQNKSQTNELLSTLAEKVETLSDNNKSQIESLIEQLQNSMSNIYEKVTDGADGSNFGYDRIATSLDESANNIIDRVEGTSEQILSELEVLGSRVLDGVTTASDTIINELSTRQQETLQQQLQTNSDKISTTLQEQIQSVVDNVSFANEDVIAELNNISAAIGDNIAEKNELVLREITRQSEVSTTINLGVEQATQQISEKQSEILAELTAKLDHINGEHLEQISLIADGIEELQNALSEQLLSSNENNSSDLLGVMDSNQAVLLAELGEKFDIAKADIAEQILAVQESVLQFGDSITSTTEQIGVLQAEAAEQILQGVDNNVKLVIDELATRQEQVVEEITNQLQSLQQDSISQFADLADIVFSLKEGESGSTDKLESILAELGANIDKLSDSNNTKIEEIIDTIAIVADSVSNFNVDNSDVLASCETILSELTIAHQNLHDSNAELLSQISDNNELLLAELNNSNELILNELATGSQNLQTSIGNIEQTVLASNETIVAANEQVLTMVAELVSKSESSDNASIVESITAGNELVLAEIGAASTQLGDLVAEIVSSTGQQNTEAFVELTTQGEQLLALIGELVAKSENANNNEIIETVAAGNVDLVDTIVTTNAELTNVIAAGNAEVVEGITTVGAELAESLANTNVELVDSIATSSAAVIDSIAASKQEITDSISLGSATVLADIADVLSTGTEQVITEIGNNSVGLIDIISAGTEQIVAESTASKTEIIAEISATSNQLAELLAEIATASGADNTNALAELAVANEQLLAMVTELIQNNAKVLDGVDSTGAGLLDVITSGNEGLLDTITSGNEQILSEITSNNAVLLDLVSELGIVSASKDDTAILSSIESGTSSVIETIDSGSAAILETLEANNSGLLESIEANSVGLLDTITSTNELVIAEIATNSQTVLTQLGSTSEQLIELIGELAANGGFGTDNSSSLEEINQKIELMHAESSVQIEELTSVVTTLKDSVGADSETSLEVLLERLELIASDNEQQFAKLNEIIDQVKNATEIDAVGELNTELIAEVNAKQDQIVSELSDRIDVMNVDQSIKIDELSASFEALKTIVENATKIDELNASIEILHTLIDSKTDLESATSEQINSSLVAVNDSVEIVSETLVGITEELSVLNDSLTGTLDATNQLVAEGNLETQEKVIADLTAKLDAIHTENLDLFAKLNSTVLGTASASSDENAAAIIETLTNNGEEILQSIEASSTGILDVVSSSNEAILEEISAANDIFRATLSEISATNDTVLEQVITTNETILSEISSNSELVLNEIGTTSATLIELIGEMASGLVGGSADNANQLQEITSKIEVLHTESTNKLDELSTVVTNLKDSVDIDSGVNLEVLLERLELIATDNEEQFSKLNDIVIQIQSTALDSATGEVHTQLLVDLVAKQDSNAELVSANAELIASNTDLLSSISVSQDTNAELLVDILSKQDSNTEILSASTDLLNSIAQNQDTLIGDIADRLELLGAELSAETVTASTESNAKMTEIVASLDAIKAIIQNATKIDELSANIEVLQSLMADSATGETIAQNAQTIGNTILGIGDKVDTIAIDLGNRVDSVTFEIGNKVDEAIVNLSDIVDVSVAGISDKLDSVVGIVDKIDTVVGIHDTVTELGDNIVQSLDLTNQIITEGLTETRDRVIAELTIKLDEMHIENLDLFEKLNSLVESNSNANDSTATNAQFENIVTKLELLSVETNAQFEGIVEAITEYQASIATNSNEQMTGELLEVISQKHDAVIGELGDKLDAISQDATAQFAELSVAIAELVANNTENSNTDALVDVLTSVESTVVDALQNNKDTLATIETNLNTELDALQTNLVGEIEINRAEVLQSLSAKIEELNADYLAKIEKLSDNITALRADNTLTIEGTEGQTKLGSQVFDELTESQNLLYTDLVQKQQELGNAIADKLEELQSENNIQIAELTTLVLSLQSDILDQASANTATPNLAPMMSDLTNDILDRQEANFAGIMETQSDVLGAVSSIQDSVTQALDTVVTMQDGIAGTLDSVTDTIDSLQNSVVDTLGAVTETIDSMQTALMDAVVAQGDLIGGINEAQVENFAVLEAKNDAMMEMFATTHADLLEQINGKQDFVLQELIQKQELIQQQLNSSQEQINNVPFIDLAERQELIVTTLTDVLNAVNNVDTETNALASDNIIEIKELQSQLLQSVLEIQENILTLSQNGSDSTTTITSDNTTAETNFDATQILSQQELILDSLNTIGEAITRIGDKDSVQQDSILIDIAQKQDDLFVDMTDRQDALMMSIAEIKQALIAGGFGANVASNDMADAFQDITERQDVIIDRLENLTESIANGGAISVGIDTDAILDLTAKQDVILDSLASVQVEISQKFNESQQSIIQEIAGKHGQIIADINDRLSTIAEDNGLLIADIATRLERLHEENKIVQETSMADSDATVAWQDTVLEEIAALKDIIEIKAGGIQTSMQPIDNAQLGLESLTDASDLVGQINSLQNTNQQLLSRFDELRLKLEEIEISNTLNSNIDELDDIKGKLDGVEGYLGNFNGVHAKLLDDLTYIRSQIEFTSQDIGTDDVPVGYEHTRAIIGSSDKTEILRAIEQVKAQLGVPSYDVLAEVIAIREEIQATKILEQTDIAAELEGLRSEIRELKSTSNNDYSGVEYFGEVLDQIELLKDQSQNILQQVQNQQNQNTHIAPNNVAVGGITGDVIDKIFGQIAAIRAEVAEYSRSANSAANIATNAINGALPIELLPDLGNLVARELRPAIDELVASQMANGFNSFVTEFNNVRTQDAATLQAIIDTSTQNTANIQSIIEENLALRTEVSEIKALLSNVVAQGSLAPISTDVHNDIIAKMNDAFMNVGSDINALRQDLGNLENLNLDNAQINVDNSEIIARLDVFGEQLLALSATTATSLDNAQISVDNSEIIARLDTLSSDVYALGGIDNNEIISRIDSLSSDIYAITNADKDQTNDQIIARLDGFSQELNELREASIGIIELAQENTNGVDNTAITSAVMDRLDTFGAELKAMQYAQVAALGSASVTQKLDVIREDMLAIYESIGAIVSNNTTIGTTDNAEILAKLDELNAQIATFNINSQGNTNYIDNNGLLMDKLLEFGDELSDLKFDINKIKDTDINSNDILVKIDEVNTEIRAIYDAIGTIVDTQGMQESNNISTRLDDLVEQIANIGQNIEPSNNQNIVDTLVDFGNQLNELRAIVANNTNLNIDVDNSDIIDKIDTDILEKLEFFAEEIKTLQDFRVVSDDLVTQIDELKIDIGNIYESINTLVDTYGDNQSNTSLLEQLQSKLEELGANNNTEILTKLQEFTDDIHTLQQNFIDLSSNKDGTTDIGNDHNNELYDRLDEVRGDIQGFYDSIAELIDSNVDNNNTQIMDKLTQLVESKNPNNNDDILDRLEVLSTEIATLKGQNNILDLTTQLEEFAVNLVELKDSIVDTSELSTKLDIVQQDITDLREQGFVNTELDRKLEEVRADIGTIYESLSSLVALADSQNVNPIEPNDTVLAELRTLRDELNDIKATVLSGKSQDASDEMSIITDQLDTLYREIRHLKQNSEEPDYGVIQEILTLRDEFQSVKTKLGDLQDANIAKQADNDTNRTELLLGEIKELRDQLFAISMAQVGNGDNTSYETYNNIILDEVAGIRKLVANFKDGGSTNDNAIILSELESLKRQIEVLKIAPTDGNLDTKLNALRKDIGNIIKSEIATVVGNTSVLGEIASIRDNVAQSNVAQDERLSQSILELKKDLSQMADIMGDREIDKDSDKTINEASVDPIAKLKSNVSKAKKTIANKKSKNDNVNATSDIDQEIVLVKQAIKDDVKDKTPDELMTLIGETTIEMMQGASYEQENRVFKTGELDVAQKLATQVANKLILEQLVAALSEGGIPSNQIDEIVKDIIPAEYNTVQVDKQSEEIKKLAKELVLDKLQNKLQKDDNNNNNND